ncbi:MAG: choice-of-anchor J domain-containing protein [Flavobacteriales bacterium]|nr:choice-of-anchor J domain-containing protein [Flavobacteriales bacterium]
MSFAPECWTTVDADGDGNNWGIFEIPEENGGASEGVLVAGSASWDGVPLTPDNYLITPQLSVGAGESLTFDISAIDPGFFAEQYQVLVSTTGTELADFTDEIVTETLEDAEWQARSYDLSDYEGEEIYIAWRHFDTEDQNLLTLDNVVLPGEIINCEPCSDLPTITSDDITCDGDNWTLNLGFTPAEGVTYTVTTSEGDDVAVADEGIYDFGPYANGTEVVFTINIDGEPDCSQEIGAITGDCSEPCEDIVDGPFTNFDTAGIPTPDENGDCDVVTIEAFEIFASEAYTLSGLPENTVYEFNACEGPGAGSFEITYTVFDGDGNVVASGNDGDGCTISWNTEDGGDFVVGITRVGYCGTAQGISNGYPSVTCSGVVGTQDLESVDAKVFPNPASDNVKVVTPLQGDAQINVYDAVGRVVISERNYLSNANFELNVNDLAKGTYILQITTDERVATTRFVKN